MRERDVERALVRRVRELGGRAYKWSSPARRGVPDRIVVLPGGIVEFVELKAPGASLTPLQVRECGALEDSGFRVVVLDSVPAARAYAPADSGVEGRAPRRDAIVAAVRRGEMTRGDVLARALAWLALWAELADGAGDSGFDVDVGQEDVSGLLRVLRRYAGEG